MKFTLVAILMMCALNVLSKEIHMHLHFENLDKQRKLAFS